MANIRFLTGSLENLKAKNADGTPKIPIVAGTVYFAISEDKDYGYLVYDVTDTERVVMNTKSEEAQKLTHTLTIGETIFDGTKDVVIPMYKGSARWDN